MTGTALVAVQRHRRFLRRYVKLHPGAPETFTCDGGWHEAIASIGDFPGAIVRGSVEEQKLRPPRIDERWPMTCGCGYEFTSRDRYQFFTLSLDDLNDATD